MDAFGLNSLRFMEREMLSGSASIRVYHDNTDTWSHGVDRFDTESLGEFSGATAWAIAENGPLLASQV